MSVELRHDYRKGLLSAEPTFFGSYSVSPPPGAQVEERIEPGQIIPPINTDIDFNMLSPFKLSDHGGLSALSEKPLDETFNWRDGSYDSNKKRFVLDQKLRKLIPLIASPGNQMLCGSCWAISASEIVGDSFVISGVVDWKPNLSTTYALACYPQEQCMGGNPAKLLIDLSRGGTVSNNCIDYSWCSQDSYCNGDALKHFKQQNKTAPSQNLSALIPTCGCYNNTEFMKFMVDSEPPPQQLSIGVNNMDQQKLTRVIKAHIRYNGPVLGSFLVFENFMKGYFARGKLNKGLYLENANYDSNGQLTWVDLDDSTYKGSHAVAIIGWGVEKDVQVDSSGTKKDVSYWFVRNSWTSKWADKGYFKMPMYPTNLISQFDKKVQVNSEGSLGSIVEAGGMVIFRTSAAPKKVSFAQVANEFLTKKRAKPSEYYERDQKERPPPIPSPHFGSPKKDPDPSRKDPDPSRKDPDPSRKVKSLRINLVLGGTISGVLVLLAFIFVLGYLDGQGHEKKVQKVLICTIVILTVITTVLTARAAINSYCKQ